MIQAWPYNRFNIHISVLQGNSCYYSVQTLLSSRLLSKNLKMKMYESIILPVVLYGCETWSPTLRVFENRILRRIFGPKSDENGDWRKLHNEELHSLYRSPNIVRVIKSRRLRWTGHVTSLDKILFKKKMWLAAPKEATQVN